MAGGKICWKCGAKSESGDYCTSCGASFQTATPDDRPKHIKMGQEMPQFDGTTSLQRDGNELGLLQRVAAVVEKIDQKQTPTQKTTCWFCEADIQSSDEFCPHCSAPQYALDEKTRRQEQLLRQTQEHFGAEVTHDPREMERVARAVLSDMGAGKSIMKVLEVQRRYALPLMLLKSTVGLSSY